MISICREHAGNVKRWQDGQMVLRWIAALVALVARRVADRRMLKLLRAWLWVGVLEGGVTTETGSGTPQGSPISPLLANVAFHVLDAEWTRHSSRLGMLVRYADDLVILCASRARAEEAHRRVAASLAKVGLRGWGAYFRWGNSAAKFAAIDRYVHERLAIFARNKHGRRRPQLGQPR